MPARARSFRAEAVVLRHNDWGEADRLLVLFTRKLGKIRAIAKGVRKPRSRKAGHLEPFTRVDLLLARGRDLFIVTQAETVKVYLPIRQDLLLVGYASYIVELLDRFIYEEGENRAIYRLLTDTLERISTHPNPEVAVRYYEVRLLDLVGFRPQLFKCVKCEAEIQAEDQFFSAEQGGVLCPACGNGVPGARPIRMLPLKYLRHFQRSSYNKSSRAPITPGVNHEMEVLMQHYLAYLLERGLNTPSFIRRVKRGEPSD